MFIFVYDAQLNRFRNAFSAATNNHGYLLLNYVLFFSFLVGRKPQKTNN